MKSLIHLVETLRGEEGCPWDKKQTPQSMADYLVDEVYELLDAIESENPDHVCEELGDVLFHIFFLARLFQERGDFDIGDVAHENWKKMIHRHPHVFGGIKMNHPDQVKKQWHQIKQNEKNRGEKGSALEKISKRMPALMRAYKISEMAARSGFDWDDISGAMQKVEEEWSEFKAEIEAENRDETDQHDVDAEFGDLLFAFVNLARFVDIHPERALSGAIKKFERRFKQMEKIILKNEKTIGSLSTAEMDVMWEEAKRDCGGC